LARRLRFTDTSILVERSGCMDCIINEPSVIVLYQNTWKHTEAAYTVKMSANHSLMMVRNKPHTERKDISCPH
jgi:hypothetical protein